MSYTYSLEEAVFGGRAPDKNDEGLSLLSKFRFGKKTKDQTLEIEPQNQDNKPKLVENSIINENLNSSKKSLSLTNTRKYILAATIATGVLIVGGTTYYNLTRQNKDHKVEEVAQIEEVVERLNGLESIIGTVEKDKTGKPLVFRIDMNFDGEVENVNLTTKKDSVYEVKYPNQKSESLRISYKDSAENVVFRYFFTPDKNSLASLKKNPKMLCELKDYSQKLTLWTSANDSDFTNAYARLATYLNNPKCDY